MCSTNRRVATIDLYCPAVEKATTDRPGAPPTIMSYDASAVKTYNETSCQACFSKTNTYILCYIEKNPTYISYIKITPIC
jgi:hypothetical protein